MLAPAAPLLLLDPQLFCWVQILGSFTMFPLLVKDKLRLPYLACCMLYTVVVSVLDGVAETNTKATDSTFGAVFNVVSARSWSDFACLVQDLVASKRVKSTLLAFSCAGSYSCYLVWVFLAWFSDSASSTLYYQGCSCCICWSCLYLLLHACRICTRRCSPSSEPRTSAWCT